MENMEYYTRRLSCSDEEKNACLETAVKLFRLWSVVRKHGLLAVDLSETGEESDPFFRACLRDFSEFCEAEEDWIASLRKLYTGYLMAGDYSGGEFLNNVLIMEGLLLLAQKYDSSLSSWADSFYLALGGYFGAAYRDTFHHAIRREVKAWKRANRSERSFLPEFDRLGQLPAEQCARLLREIPKSTLTIAVRFAGAAVQDHLLASLTPEQREQFTDAFELCTNLRVSDVEAAQRAVLEAVAHQTTESVPQR